MRTFVDRFVRSNPRTAATALLAFVALMGHYIPDVAKHVPFLESDSGLVHVIAIIVFLQGILGGDAKQQMPHSEIGPNTEVVVDSEPSK